MNEAIINKLEQGKTELVVEYDTVEQRWVATIREVENGGVWWECEIGIGNTPDSALNKLGQHIATDQPAA